MIRQATINDAKAIAKLIVSSWQTAYKGLIDDEFLNNMSIDIMSKRWEQNILSQNADNHIYVYEEENKILGVIRFGKPDDKNDLTHNAEIHVLYVEPTLKRQGIGTKLFNFSKDYFIKNNLNYMIIWCLKDNTPSIKFYETMGGKIIDERKSTVNNINLVEYGLEYTLNKITLEEYRDKYAEAMSKIIISNLLQINSKDYGIENVTNFAKEFTTYEIQKNFPKKN